MAVSTSQPLANVPTKGQTAGAPAMLQVVNLHKTYHLGHVDVPVLRGVSLSVKKGEFVAILGASGSGKSTLLHLLGGLDRPDPQPGYLVLAHKDEKGRPVRLELREQSIDETGIGGDDPKAPVIRRILPRSRRGRKLAYKRGVRALKKHARRLGVDKKDLVVPPFVPGARTYSEILFNGRALTDMAGSELDRYRSLDVGFVFQFYHLLPELSVVENVLLGPMIRYGRWGYLARAAKIKAAAGELISKVGLSHRLNHRPAELSGGERQRVAIARALINEPRVLLADEPTGNLDHVTGGKILDMIMDIRRERQQTMVVVTHDEETARRADRVIRLMDGQVVEG
jgi:ABC-type lipoprotein export system ATPase subunit